MKMESSERTNMGKISFFLYTTVDYSWFTPYFLYMYGSLGYHGLYCEEEYNECLSAPCQNYATCRDLINAYECICPPQYEGTYM